MVQEKMVSVLQDRVWTFQAIWEPWASYMHTPLAQQGVILHVDMGVLSFFLSFFSQLSIYPPGLTPSRLLCGTLPL